MTAPDTQPAWLKRLIACTPSQETLAAHPWLKPIAHRLLDPALWKVQQEAVARGVAIGIFWAFAIPLAQFIAAAAHSVWWRANIPAAIGMTLITNPLTVGFWLWLAYKLGSLVLDAPPPVVKADGGSVVDWITSFGGPALLGMGIFAVGGAAIGYVTVKLAWAAWSWLEKKRSTPV
ncbi:MAG: hypothetical protein JWP47_2445 [Polaromonas sp.]|jgi:uncharacterized protein (DUF2062 family)|nr:hypothetical protein [Polaromonas sp.]